MNRHGDDPGTTRIPHPGIGHHVSTLQIAFPRLDRDELRWTVGDDPNGGLHMAIECRIAGDVWAHGWCAVVNGLEHLDETDATAVLERAANLLYGEWDESLSHRAIHEDMARLKEMTLYATPEGHIMGNGSVPTSRAVTEALKPVALTAMAALLSAARQVTGLAYQLAPALDSATEHLQRVAVRIALSRSAGPSQDRA